MDQAVGKYKTRFLGRTPLNGDVQTNLFEKPKGFTYFAGQYLRWTLPSAAPDDRGTSRYFTISASPTENHLAITTKRGESTFKDDLFDLKEGEVVDFFGPLGNLFIPEQDISPRVMLAGGIGITPFRSILKYANDKKIPNKITLLVSFSHLNEVIFYDELKEVEKVNENIKAVFTLTKEEVEGYRSGRITGEMIEKYAPYYKDSTFFVVGPSAMSEAMEEIAIGMGIKGEKIIRENFTGY